MIPFERRQRIVSLLREQPGLKVTELARQLGVSEGTIRNDLNTLEGKGELTRVRGGAVIPHDRPIISPAFAARLSVNAKIKQRIARNAASLVEDGDSILLDASTTVFAMVPYLANCRHLTVVTNGIEAGLALARNSSHAVILVGGMIRPDGASVVGHLGEKLLEGLHIKTAFVSCSGFSVEAGLTEVDIQEVQIKRKMIECAERVVALVDSRKFGRVDLTSFASLAQVSHVVTDSNLDSRFVEQLRPTGVSLTICDEGTASSFTPRAEKVPRYKIGFASLSEQNPFAVDVQRGLERAAQLAGNVDLVIGDNQLSGQVALEVASYLIDERVDLVIEYQIDEKVGNQILSRYHQAGIPVIAVDIPMVGATFFGVDNYRAGHMAGIALGRWAAENWNGRIDRLIVLEEPRAGSLPAARLVGQVNGLQEIVGEIEGSRVIHLDSGHTSQRSEAEVCRALQAMPNEHQIAVVTINDDAAVGAVRAARSLDRERDIVIVGQGADRIAREEIRRLGSRLIGSTAYWPERYGEKLLPLAMKILLGEAVPPAVYIDHTFIDARSIDEYYPE